MRITVPDASICIIDTAEQFGLSQLHQIRGRIGRGLAPSSETLQECHCILLHKPQSGSIRVEKDQHSDESSPSGVNSAMTRLQVLVNCNDGFEIADADLQLRGPGDMYGLGATQGADQSGAMNYRAVRLPADLCLLADAKTEAEKLSHPLVGENRIGDFYINGNYNQDISMPFSFLIKMFNLA